MLLAGRAVADITGEAAGGELLGYGKSDQIAEGIHQRLRARAFVFVEAGEAGEAAEGATRVAIVVADLGMIFDSVHREVLSRLAARFGDRYRADNVVLTATHTHAGCGGYSHHLLYIFGGYHPATFEAIVAGIVDAVVAADADVAPATVRLAHGELTDASVNRSPTAFARNPQSDRAFFPDGIDPQTTVMAVERDGALVGYLNLFATHGTSLTNANRLISGDNKGYAAHHAERTVAGGDHLAGRVPVVAAFAQTNAGDMSPNLDRAPGSGPTADPVANTRIIGRRQHDAADALARAADSRGAPARPVTGPIEIRRTVIDLRGFVVDGAFTGDGRPHVVGGPSAGAAAFAGTEEGPAFRGFHQGVDTNPVWSAAARALYRMAPGVAAAHHPKAPVVPPSPLNRSVLPLVQERVPVQLLRIGPLYLLTIPGEVTIVAGLRLRRAVAAIVGANLADVLILGYANAYIHYVTTPEEYDVQRYEGGSTLFGRWELGAFLQTATALATALRDGRPMTGAPEPPDLSGRRRYRPRPQTLPVQTAGGLTPGTVLLAPRPRYHPGDQVRAVFATVHPADDPRRGGTYLEVQRWAAEEQAESQWERIADDGDWSTTIRWHPGKPKKGRPVRATVTWDIDPAAPAGRYRIVCFPAPDREVATPAFDVTSP